MSAQSVSFSKTMYRSNISSHPWQLCVPKKFCDAHLPCHDSDVILVDESEREHTVVFLITQTRFGRGWRDFVDVQGLLEGDKLSFHLIDRCKFKVHITRTSRFTEDEFQNNVPVGFGKREDPAKDTCTNNTVTQNFLVSSAVDSHQMLGRILCRIKTKVHEIEKMVSKEKVHITRASRFTEGERQKNVTLFFGKREDPAEDNTCKVNTVAQKYPVSSAVDSRQMQDRILCQVKKKMLQIEKMVSKEKVQCRVYSRSRNRSTGTKGADGSSRVNFLDCPNVDEHKMIVEKEFPAVDASEETLPESDYDSTPLEGQSVSSENSKSALSFMDFEDFKIDVNGETLDS